MTNYSRGTRLEYAVMKAYQAGGWFVMRSAGSHGVADLHCANWGTNLYIQCKRDMADAAGALAELKAAIPRGPGRVLAVWTGTPSKPNMPLVEKWE